MKRFTLKELESHGCGENHLDIELGWSVDEVDRSTHLYWNEIVIPFNANKRQVQM